MKKSIDTPAKRKLFKKLFGGKVHREEFADDLQDGVSIDESSELCNQKEYVGDINVIQIEAPDNDDIIKRSEKAAEKLHTSLKNGEPSQKVKNVSSESANFAGGAAAVVAGVALLTPRPANAWVGDIVDGIVEKAGAAVLEPLKSLFSNLMEGFGLSNMFSTQEGAKAQGRSTDAINEVNHSVENAKVMRATEPPPHMCLNIQERKHLFNTYEKQKTRTKESQAKYYTDSVEYGNGSHVNKVFKEIKMRHTGSDNSVRTLLKTSPIITDSEDTLIEETRENAILSVDAMVAPTADKIGRVNIEATGGFRANEARKISLHNRLSIARNVLIKEVEEKAAPVEGEASTYEARKLMVERTHGSGTEWYEEVLSKGDATPLLKDQIVLTGATNSLLFDLIESSRDTNRLLATQLISTVERT